MRRSSSRKWDEEEEINPENNNAKVKAIVVPTVEEWSMKLLD